MSAGHIRAAHIGLLLKRLVHSTLTYGYTGVPIPGDLTRRGKPRSRWEVDAETAKWVIKVFEWSFHQRMNYRQIARRLNHEGAPPPPKGRKWTWRAVKYLLMNRRYVGDWSYGWRETIWQSGADYGRQFAKDRPTHEHADESLRVVPDVLFLGAQERIAARRGRGGRPCHKDHGGVRDFLLEILCCPTHDRRLSARGHGGRALGCSERKAEEDRELQPLFSLVDRRLARRQICQAIGVAIRADREVVAMAIDVARRRAAAAQAPDPAELARLVRERQRLTDNIAFVLANPGETETDRAENGRFVSAHRAERAEVERKIAEANAAAASAGQDPPTESELVALLDDMGTLLLQAADSNDPQESGEALRLIIDLTGGRIELTQQGERRQRRGWLRGTFRLRLLDTLLTRSGLAPAGDQGVEVVIDFREPDEIVELADAAKALWDKGLLVKQIAAELTGQRGVRMTRTIVAKALAHWFESRGLPVPDGRSRRSTLPTKHLVPPPYQAIAKQVMDLCDGGGKLLGEIAEELGVDRNTVTATIRWLHEQRGLPVPDGRTRRKQLDQKSRPRVDGPSDASTPT